MGDEENEEGAGENAPYHVRCRRGMTHVGRTRSVRVKELDLILEEKERWKEEMGRARWGKGAKGKHGRSKVGQRACEGDYMPT